MKLLVDCSSARMGGAQTYLEEFLRAAGNLPGGHRWVVYGPPGCRRRLESHSADVELKESPASCAAPLGTLNWLSRILPKQTIEEKADAVFASTGFGMLRPTRPQVLLVRNPIYFSDLYLKRTRDPRLWVDVAVRRQLSLRVIRASQGVIFPTQAMRESVARYTSGEGTRWAVIPYGCSGTLFSPGKADPADLPRVLRENPGGFLLNVSHYCAQKNFTVLFEALGLLRRRGTAPLLALTTRMSPAPNCSFRQDQAALSRENLRDQVLELGPLSRETLPSLYRSARLFVFPSYVESFGHPLVEAMACGLPILAADTPVNREICAEAALYADPFNAAEWADRIQRLLSDSSLSRRLADAGFSRSRAFSWSSHVAGVARICEEAAGAHA